MSKCHYRTQVSSYGNQSAAHCSLTLTYCIGPSCWDYNSLREQIVWVSSHSSPTTLPVTHMEFHQHSLPLFPILHINDQCKEDAESGFLIRTFMTLSINALYSTSNCLMWHMLVKVVMFCYLIIFKLIFLPFSFELRGNQISEHL